MTLNNPEARRALRSVVQAVVALTVIALAWWVCDDLTTEQRRYVFEELAKHGR